MKALVRLSPLVRIRLATMAPANAVRLSSSSSQSAPPSQFESMPSPPRLPPDQQAEFERLQRNAAVAIGSGASVPQLPTRMPPPEFEGEKNPRTGEVGGPKNEPLRWGSKGDWSYHGRVTDF